MKEILLANGQHAIVDDQDYEAVSRYTWRTSRGHVVRSYRTEGKSPVREFLHRRLCQVSPKLDVVHRNHNKLDNRRENLMVVTRGASTQFKAARSKSGLKGVAKSKTAFMAQICINKKQLYIGRFNDPLDAARAYDYAALMYYGPSARVNFGPPNPELLPELVKERCHEFDRKRIGEPASEQSPHPGGGTPGDGQNDLQCVSQQASG